MDDFTSKPGVPNMFHLIQSAANAIAPGKRPLSAMTPTIVAADICRPGPRSARPANRCSSWARPAARPSSPPSPTTSSSILDNGLNVQQAADAPRFHHQYLPDTLQVEKAFPLDVVDKLKATGYTITRTNEADEKNPGVWGDSEMIYIDPKTGTLLGADDQRHKFGKAAGY